MKRVWIYARVPFSDQATRGQIEELKRSAGRKGWIIAGSSWDTGIKHQPRPGFQEMMGKVKRQEVDMIYFPSMRQISRRRRLQYRFFKQLIRYGVGAAAMDYDLGYVAQGRWIGRKIERWSRARGVPTPWCFISAETE